MIRLKSIDPAKGNVGGGERLRARKRFLFSSIAGAGVVAALIGIGLTGPSGVQHATAASARPNIIVIESDDQTVESMRVMSNVRSLIGDQGARFKRSFVNYALCCPSRSTFLTGQYMHNHGVLGNVPPSGGFIRFQELHGDNNLAVWLQDAGYHTAMIGRYLNEYASDPPVPPGWSEWYAAGLPAPPSAADTLSADANTVKAYNYTLDENGTSVAYGQSPADFKQDVLTGKAVDFLNRQARDPQPFFLWLTYTAPHTGGPNPSPNPPFNCQYAAKPAPRHANAFDAQPLPKPPSFNEADVSDKPAAIRSLPLLSASKVTDIQRRYRCYLESLLSVDEGVKSVVDTLSANGQLANTLVVFTSDNGFFFGAHRIPNGKTRIYEDSIRVPLQMRGPGIPPGVTVNDLVSNADLAPTIAEAANIVPRLVMDGRSLIPVAQNPGIEQGRELLIEEPRLKAIRTDQYIYAEHDTGEKELYDLARDPFELRSRDRDPAYASIASQLATRLHELQNCSGLSCRTHSAVPGP